MGGAATPQGRSARKLGARFAHVKYIMDLLPQGYHLDDSTWFYLSMLLILAVYFRFHRLWSLRNVDLCLLLSASPGLILLDSPQTQRAGAVLLTGVTGLILIRLLVDGLLVRRPHTTQNLNPAGMAFLCASAFVLLSMHSMSEPLLDSTTQALQLGDELINRTARPDLPAATAEPTEEVGPGPTVPVIAASFEVMFQHLAPRVMAMAAHLAVIVGLLFVGRNLFGDLQLGTAMAALYMLIPCTAFGVGEFNHVLPSALLVWAIVAYRRPTVSGCLMGLACGTLVFPVFLVPLWAAFYGRRRAGRFLTSLAIVTCALLGTYALTSADPVSFWRQAVSTIKLPLHALLGEDISVSSWTEISTPHRIPIVVGYFVMLIALTVWPRHKSIEHLIAASTALIVGTQFWYPQQVGAYLLWYLPLLLIVVFRPRIAQLEQHQTPTALADVKASSAKAPIRPSRGIVSGNALRSATLFR